MKKIEDSEGIMAAFGASVAFITIIMYAISLVTKIF